MRFNYDFSPLIHGEEGESNNGGGRQNDEIAIISNTFAPGSSGN